MPVSCSIFISLPTLLLCFWFLSDKQEVLAGLGSEAKTRSTRSNDSIVKIKPKSEYRAQLDLSAKDLLGKLKAELSLNQYKQILVALSEYKYEFCRNSCS